MGLPTADIWIYTTEKGLDITGKGLHNTDIGLLQTICTGLYTML